MTDPQTFRTVTFQVTFRYHESHERAGQIQARHQTAVRGVAEAWVKQAEANPYRYGVPGEVEVLTHVWKIGQPVAVRAFGAWRSGKVVKVGRRNVTVEYVRNNRGDRSTRPFPAASIRP